MRDRIRLVHRDAGGLCANTPILAPQDAPKLQSGWQRWWETHRRKSVLQHNNLAVASFGSALRTACATRRFLEARFRNDDSLLDFIDFPFYVRGSAATSDEKLYEMFLNLASESTRRFAEEIKLIEDLTLKLPKDAAARRRAAGERLKQLQEARCSELPTGGVAVQSVVFALERKDKEAHALGNMDFDEVCLVRIRNNVPNMESIRVVFVRLTENGPRVVGIK
jgi:hypothetical protein